MSIKPNKPAPWRPTDAMLASLDPLRSDHRLTLDQRESVEVAIERLKRLVAERDRLLHVAERLLIVIEAGADIGGALFDEGMAAVRAARGH